MSAHDTVPGQALSMAALIMSTVSNPLAVWKFGAASFSLLMVGLLSSKRDPSHPFQYRCHAQALGYVIRD